MFAAVLRVLNRGARIPLCGMISEYNATAIPAGPNLRPLLVQRAMIKGFIVSDHVDRAPAFLQECTPLVASGRIKYREDIVDGLEHAPAAFIGLFEGQNFGKLMVRVSPDPTRAAERSAASSLTNREVRSERAPRALRRSAAVRIRTPLSHVRAADYRRTDSGQIVTTNAPRHGTCRAEQSHLWTRSSRT